MQRTVHGSNPQFLIEKILRERIFESEYWKLAAGLDACSLVDRACVLQSVGGQFGNQKPTEFICLALKMLQIQPEHEIVLLYLQSPFKYLVCLGALHIRLTCESVDIYQLLEPLLSDRRKLRVRRADGLYSLTYMDVFIDELLHSDRACDTILPRLALRHILEDAGMPLRVSPLEDELDEQESVLSEESQPKIPGNSQEFLEEQQMSSHVQETSILDLPLPNDVRTKAWSKKKVKGLFKKPQAPKPAAKTEHSEEGMDLHDSNALRASLGLAPLH